MTLIPKESQGNVAGGKGAKFAKQIALASGDVTFVDKKPSGALRYAPTRPEKDERLKRPGYTNNVSVLIDMRGQEFQFKAPLGNQPVSIDLDIAYSVLDRVKSNALKGGQFQPERPPPDMLGFMLKQQQKDEALHRLERKELEMLYEGFSPEQVAAMSSEERGRLIRKSQMGSRLDAVLRQAMGEVQHETGEAGLSAGVGHVRLDQGIQTVPALSVPMITHDAGPDAGETDVMGRTRATGAPSQGHVNNRAPATTASVRPGMTTEGQRPPFLEQIMMRRGRRGAPTEPVYRSDGRLDMRFASSRAAAQGVSRVEEQEGIAADARAQDPAFRAAERRVAEAVMRAEARRPPAYPFGR